MAVSAAILLSWSARPEAELTLSWERQEAKESGCLNRRSGNRNSTQGVPRSIPNSPVEEEASRLGSLGPRRQDSGGDWSGHLTPPEALELDFIGNRQGVRMFES